MIGRFDLFYSLEPEKQKQIIDSAMTEFGEKGFRRASTNAIVENAGISKGILFYYFGSKEELFDFLCEYTLEFWKAEYSHNFYSKKSGDFLERCKILSEFKRRAITEFPVIIRFFECIYLPENEERMKKHQEAAAGLREDIRRNLYDDIDYSLFRDDIDPQNIIKYTKWLMDSYEASVMQKVKSENLKYDMKNFDEEWKNFYDLMDDLRKIFYKN